MISYVRDRAIITGASSGIGREIAKCLAGRGYDVVLVARRNAELIALAEALGPGSACFPCDLAVDEEIDRLIASFPETTVLINCAGFGSLCSFAHSDWAIHRSMVMLNVMAVCRLCHHYLPSMINSNNGSILNVSSTAGEGFAPHYATYVGTKAFILQFSRSLALELPQGVTVSCLVPGPTDTEFFSVAGIAPTRSGFFQPLACPRDVAEFSVRLLEKGRLSGSPGVINNLKRGVKRLLPEIIWSKIISAYMVNRKIG